MLIAAESMDNAGLDGMLMIEWEQSALILTKWASSPRNTCAASY